MTSRFVYRLFGMTIVSDVELPELEVAPAPAKADIRIEFVDAEPVPAPGHDVRPDGAALTLAVAGVATYRAIGGQRLSVAPDPGAPPQNIRLYLLGSAMGMLLHQAGVLPLHANAIAIDDGVIAVMGAPGAGKSTLAAWFNDHGYDVLSDDVCAVEMNRGDAPTVSSGLPRLRLWREALERSGRDHHCYAPSYSGDLTFDKYDVPTARRSRRRSPIALSAIYLLADADERSITPLSGAQAIAALMANTYRGAYAAPAGQVEGHFRSCVELGRQVPVFTFARRRAFETLGDDVAALVSHARDIGEARRNPTG